MQFIVAMLLLNTHLLAIQIEAGWHLLGVPIPTTIEAIKKANNLTDVRRFDTDRKAWVSSGEVGWNEGVLLYAPSPIALNYNSIITGFNPTSHADDSYNITLKKGWNLKALSTNLSVASKLFGDDVSIWLYDDQKWVSYLPHIKGTKANKQSIIKSGQGFFIYAPDDRTYKLKDLRTKLTTFDNEAKMLDFLEKNAIFNRSFRSDDDRFFIAEGDGKPMPGVGSAGSSNKGAVDDATHTNVQEQGVDEADIIKHNNNNIFYLATDDKGKSRLYTHTFADLVAGQKKAQEISVFTDEKSVQAQDLYLYNDQLIVLGNSFHAYRIAAEVSPKTLSRMVLPPYFMNNEIYIEVYDVKDIKAIKRTQSIKVQGHLNNTRLANGKLYVVSSYNPYLKVTYKRTHIPCKDGYYQLVDKEGKCYEIDYDDYTIKEKHLIPKITHNGKSSDLVGHQHFYSAMKVNNLDQITTTTAFDLSGFESKNLSLMINSYQLYMSPKALYLTHEHYDYSPFTTASSERIDRTKTAIYKIALDKQLDFIDHIVIEGRAINQFAFSEYKGVLRVATTKGYAFNDTTDNMVYTIAEENGVLKQKALLKGLGKKGEVIRAVRFMGDKGFVVTFKQTDPFYTIDLSDPDSPKKAGELSIPGFSTYLHSVGDNQILALGNDADSEGRVTAMQVQLFDISTFKSPKLVDKYLFDKTAFSNALYNHKAFTFRPSDKKFAIYINSYDYKSHTTTFRGFYIFELSNGDIKEQGKIEIPTDDKHRYSYYDARSIIFSKTGKDYILFLTNDLKVYPIK